MARVDPAEIASARPRRARAAVPLLAHRTRGARRKLRVEVFGSWQARSRRKLSLPRAVYRHGLRAQEAERFAA